MKLFNLGIQFVVIGCLMTACQAPTEKIDNQETTTTEEVSQPASEVVADQPQTDGVQQQDAGQTASPTQDQGTAEQRQQPHAQQKPANRDGNAKRVNSDLGVSGTQIIESTTGKLRGKLKLTDQQAKSVTEILTSTYINSGEPLTKMYSIEDSRTIGRDLRKNAYQPIHDILNDTQKEHFEKFINK